MKSGIHGKTMENHVSLMNEVPVDGCLVLGRNGPSYSTYNTRYYVDRKARRDYTKADILLDSCVPCCTTENQSALNKAVWSVLRSESFLFCLHALVLCIGVTKESLDFEETDLSLYLYQSIVETILATFQMIVRIISVWLSFRNMKLPALSVEYVEEELGSVREQGLRKVVLAYIGTVTALAVINLVLFVVFHQWLHLGWTVMTNNLCLLVITLMAGVLQQRMAAAEHRMVVDDHTVALCETSLLLKESFMLTNKEDRQDYLMRVERFLTAFKNTAYFSSMPPYIHVLKEHVPDWNLYSSSEHITVV